MSDIIVIGGGIAGLSAAARLSASATVLVLEGEEAMGYHASGRSAALIEENYGAPSVQALNRASMAYLAAENGGYLSQRGLLIIAGAHERDGFKADVEAMGVTEISAAEAQDFVPILDPAKVTLAGYHADAFDIDTDRLMQDFNRVIRGNGGKVQIRAFVTAITRQNGKWHVTTKDQVHVAETLVNAAGAWADQIAAMAGIEPLGIIPYRRSMARIPAPGGHDMTRWPMFFGVGETWYAKPDAGALLVSPAEAEATTPHDAYADDMVLAEGLARYENMVVEPVTRLLASWAGLRSFAPDRTLVLGRDPTNTAFVWSAGQGGYGFQTSPAASQMVADLVNGRHPALEANLVAQLTPDRLRK